MVDVQWWETDKPNGSFCETTEPLRELMKKKWSRELMRDFLKKEHGDDEEKIIAIVGDSNWRKMRTNRLLPNGPRKKRHNNRFGVSNQTNRRRK